MSRDDQFSEIFQDMGEDRKVSAKLLITLFNAELTKDNPIAYLVNGDTIVYTDQGKTPIYASVDNSWGNPNPYDSIRMKVTHSIPLRYLANGARYAYTTIEIKEVAGEGWNIKPIHYQSEVQDLIEISMLAHQVRASLENESARISLTSLGFLEPEDYVYTDELDLDRAIDPKNVLCRFTGKTPTEFFGLQRTTVNYSVRDD